MLKWEAKEFEKQRRRRQRIKKAIRREFAREILMADKEPPEAAFDNVHEMLAWLNNA